MLSTEYATALYELTIDKIDKIKGEFDDFMKIISANSDFPLPDEPMMLITSPFYTEKSISFNTSLVPNDFTRCSTFKSSSISVYLL